MKKILISSIVLIAVGMIGLLVLLAIPNINNSFSISGTGRGYSLCREDMDNMSRGFQQDNELTSLSFEKVEELTRGYLETNDLQNLEIAEIMEFSKNYYIEVYEVDTGIGAIELLVDKSNGSIFPEFGPNMMWNLKYGMHSRIPITQEDIDMDISQDEARNIAQRYLVKSNKGEIVGKEVEKFYGYYTIHTLTEDEEISGMLSVNGFTGDVWYHNWHGVFIDMNEEH